MTAPPRKTSGSVPSARGRSRWIDALVGLTLGALGLLVLLEVAASLSWRVTHDAPILAYVGFLIDRHGAVPFRDLFDMNLPLTGLVFAVIDRLAGSSDPALRVADLSLLLATLALMGWAARPFGWPVRLGAPLLYAALYFHQAPLHGLQRESMIVVPLAGLLVLLGPGTDGAVVRRAFGAGLMVGLAAAIKPAMLIDLLPVLGHVGARGAREAVNGGGARGAAIAAAVCVLGCAVPLLATAAYLAANGAWAAFVDLYTGYLPLYARLDALHRTIPDGQRLGYLLAGSWAMGGYRLWLVPALAGLVAASTAYPVGSRERSYVTLVAGLLGAHLMAPALAGQFWPYHWYPLLLTIAYATALAWVPGPVRPPATRPAPAARPARESGRGPRRVRAAAALVAVAAVALWVRPPAALLLQLGGRPADTPLRPRIDAIADYLRTHRQDGDTVQPLDWTGGAVHAMWITRVPIATPFLYDFHFYHHLSRPYVQGLRARFMATLERAAPRFVIRIETQKPWVAGEDTSREFPELQRYLAAHYAVGLEGPGYQVLARRP